MLIAVSVVSVVCCIALVVASFAKEEAAKDELDRWLTRYSKDVGELRQQNERLQAALDKLAAEAREDAK